MLLSLLHCSAALADEYRDATEHAFCAGVYQADIAEVRKMGLSVDTRDVQLRLLGASAHVDGAIRQHIIDADTALRMLEAGYADAERCNQKTLQCIQERLARPDVNPDLSERQYNACILPANPICERVHKNCP
jgi:hypothetical protein